MIPFKPVRLFITMAVLLTFACQILNATVPPFPIVKQAEPKAWNYETKNWMSTIPDDVKLGELTLVSSHDAGMEDSRQFLTLFVHTQYYDIEKQANFGARFFDIRVWKTRNGFRAYHGKEGGDYLMDIFEDAARFLTDNPTETLIIKLSHWYDQNDIGDALREFLPRFHSLLFTDKSKSLPVLNTVPLGKLRGKILVLVDTGDKNNYDASKDKYAEEGLGPDMGIWRFGELSGDYKGRNGYYRIYDSYADNSNYEIMYADQDRKWSDFLNKYDPSENAFMLCWQLTGIAGPYSYASNINPRLSEDLHNLMLGHRVAPGLVNLDYIDDNVCNSVINLNHKSQKGAVSYLEPQFAADNTVTFQTRFCSDYRTIKGTYNSHIELDSGWYVVEENTDLKEGLTIEGNVHLILKDGVSLTSHGKSDPGILVNRSDVSLTIYGQSTDVNRMGKLTAYGSDGSAGIGGRANSKELSEGRNITINGGNISAYGSEWTFNGGAGIGGGANGGGHDITINGGKVRAEAGNGSRASGIGGGSGSEGFDITINGGEVYAEASRDAAGIGGGAHIGGGGTGRNIRIHGGEVTAYGGSEGGAGIGGAKDATGEFITIDGGIINATGRGGSAGIGGGYAGSGNDITISGGRITVHTDHGGAGIGGGSENWGGAQAYHIEIKGGSIDANDVANRYSIGPGANVKIRDYSTEVTITGGSIFAVGEKPEHHDITERKNAVYEVTVLDCGPTGTKVDIKGLGSYGVKDIYSNGGEVKLWLPNGNYNFNTQSHSYSVTVNGRKETAKPLQSASVRIGKSGFATLYSGKNLLVPEGVLVFAYSFDKQTLIPTEIAPGSILPANQGYVVMADEGTYEFFDFSGKEPGPYKSVLKGVTADTKVADLPEVKKSGSATVYVLGKLDKATTFYQFKGDHIPAGKAYFVLDK